MKILAENLKSGFSVYGNKGTTWNDTAHIASNECTNGQTLCGTPMLATNWARDMNVGCDECIKIYNSRMAKVEV